MLSTNGGAAGKNDAADLSAGPNAGSNVGAKVGCSGAAPVSHPPLRAAPVLRRCCSGASLATPMLASVPGTVSTPCRVFFLFPMPPILASMFKNLKSVFNKSKQNVQKVGARMETIQLQEKK